MEARDGGVKSKRDVGEPHGDMSTHVVNIYIQ